MKAVVLLATFRGASYLEAQLKSLERQTHAQWELWIHDDGSDDGTRALLERYATELSRVRLLPWDDERLGPSQSFSRLLGAALESPAQEPRAFFFCDQDDVWADDKIERSLACLGEGMGPRAVHTDLEVVSQELRPLAPSLKRLVPTLYMPKNALSALLVQNYVTGCTLAMNEAAARAAWPIPREALMHDWWVALVVSAVGRLEFLDQPLVRYRQHSSQASGGAGARRWRRYLKLLWAWEPLAELMEGRFRQARALRERLERLGARDAAEFVRAFEEASVAGMIRAPLRVLRMGIRMQTCIGTARFLALLALLQGRVRRILKSDFAASKGGSP